MKTRIATKRDIPQMAVLMLDEFRKPPWNEKANLSAVQKSLEYYLETGKAIVAIVDNEIVGSLVYRLEQYWQGPVAIIEDLAVKQHFQGKKIGRILIDALETIAKKARAKKVILITNKKSMTARFYKNNGYSQTRKVVYLEKKI
jgi:predicted N-acetyltransferase YhbS